MIDITDQLKKNTDLAKQLGYIQAQTSMFKSMKELRSQMPDEAYLWILKTVERAWPVN